MKKNQPTYNDVYNNPPNEVMKFYGLNNKQYEVAARKHMYGANQQEMRKEYEKIYPMNRRDR